jgi:hypothetical protein
VHASGRASKYGSLVSWSSICRLIVVCLSTRPQIAVRLLAHKIQSPQEWEAVQALTVGLRCWR